MNKLFFGAEATTTATATTTACRRVVVDEIHEWIGR